MHSCLQKHHISQRNMGGLKTNDLAIWPDWLCKVKHMPRQKKKRRKRCVERKSTRTVIEHWEMRRGCTDCSAAKWKALLELIAKWYSHSVNSALNNVVEKKRSSSRSACESAGSSFIRKRGALEALSVPDQLVLQLKSLLISLSRSSTLTSKLINSCPLWA